MKSVSIKTNEENARQDKNRDNETNGLNAPLGQMLTSVLSCSPSTHGGLPSFLRLLVFSLCPSLSLSSLLQSCLLQEVLHENVMCTGDVVTWPFLDPGLQLYCNSQSLVAQAVQEVGLDKTPGPSSALPETFSILCSACPPLPSQKSLLQGGGPSCHSCSRMTANLLH